MMANNSRTEARLVLVFFLISLVAANSICADETSDLVSSIEDQGGLVLRVGAEWEVDFHLRGRELTNEGLAQVVRLKNIAWMNLANTKITDSGLVHLRGLENLRRLHLENTEIGDDGVAHLTELKKLEYLNLYGSKITDKSLDHLSKLKSLKRLYVWQTGVTDAGVEQLEARLPELAIERGVDLDNLKASFVIMEEEKLTPKVSLKWNPVSNRRDAPARSDNGENVQILFENKSKRSIKLYWISFGDGELRQYGTLAIGATRQQNTYAKHVWLITDDKDQPLGYFVAEDEDGHAIIPPS